MDGWIESKRGRHFVACVCVCVCVCSSHSMQVFALAKYVFREKFSLFFQDIKHNLYVTCVCKTFAAKRSLPGISVVYVHLSVAAKL